MAEIAAISPIIFRLLASSLKIKKPITAEKRTTLTLVIASTVESVHPVVLYERRRRYMEKKLGTPRIIPATRFLALNCVLF
jgi:hypothetical protein